MCTLNNEMFTILIDDGNKSECKSETNQNANGNIYVCLIIQV